MDPYSLGTIGLFAILLLCSGFFSATETAFSSLNKIKLKHLANENNRKAALALEMVEKYDKFISTVLVGNNIVNILSSSIATVFFVDYFGNLGVTVATLVTTVLVLIFGEISPKTMAKEVPEKFAMISVYPMRFLMFVFTPLNYLTSKWRRIIIKLFRIRSDNNVTEAELLTFVEEVRQVGGINEGEEHMIRNAIEFDDLTANDILTPRVDLAAVSIKDTIESIEQCFYDTGYSRLPVYCDSIDNITGVIILKDFAHKVLKNNEPLENIIKPVLYITKTINISRLLKNLQKQKIHLAIVLDEFGGTMGIVTLEDIVEELVGEIWDEHDDVMENIISLADGYRVNGNTPLKEFFELLGIDEKNAAINASTAGGWVIEYLGEIPQEGHRFIFENYSIMILKTIRNRVIEFMVKECEKKLLVRRAPSMAQGGLVVGAKKTAYNRSVCASGPKGPSGFRVPRSFRYAPFPRHTPPTFCQPWSLLRKALIRAGKTSHTAGTLCAIIFQRKMRRILAAHKKIM
jgi:CBS domain containing-hemolysin-like protein